jgi:outer membrane protein
MGHHPRKARMTTAHAALTVALCTVAVSACVHNPPDVDGKPSAPTASNQFWTPPKSARTPDAIPKVAVPADIEQRVQTLTLPDVIEVGLLNNPLTRQSYALARAAGATIGAAHGAYLPQVTLNVTGEREGSTSSSLGATTGSGTVSNNNGSGSSGTGTGSGSTGSGTSSTSAGSTVRGGSTNSLLQPGATASWLLFDFSRSSSFKYAEESAFAASFQHNATVQTVVMAIEQAYFAYNSAKAVRDGDLKTVTEDSTSLAAAKAEHEAGVQTISDVLTAQTTLSQALLQLDTDEGTVQTTRGSLAVAIGLPANVPYDIAPEPPDIPVQGIAESVDSLVQVAVQSRPDLAGYRAQAAEADANIGVIKGEGLPSLKLGGTASHTYADPSSINGSTWSAQFGVSYPIFQGFTNSYNVLQAREQAKASHANAEFERDTVVFQVFNSYYALRTATARVASANDLLTSAQASYDVNIGKYKQGVGSILDVTTAEAALATARSQQASARWTWYSALAQLSHDVGVLGLHGETNLRLTADTTQTPPSR